MKVNDPIDDVELSYAIEALCIEAQEHDMERHEIIDVLERTAKAVKDEQLV
jgi:type II restriction/modification system DNA methylase subunit YeeA